jgi:hypothetical protein
MSYQGNTLCWSLRRGAETLEGREAECSSLAVIILIHFADWLIGCAFSTIEPMFVYRFFKESVNSKQHMAGIALEYRHRKLRGYFEATVSGSVFAASESGSVSGR